MSKQVDIEHALIKTPVHITVDGKKYPLTGWNVSVVNEYWATDDEAILEKLKDFALEF